MIPEYVAQSIHEIARRKGFVPPTYTIKTTPQDHDDQTPTTILHITVDGQRTPSIDGQHTAQSAPLQLVCKTPTTQERCDRELCAYMQVLPALAAQFQLPLTSFIQYPHFHGKCEPITNECPSMKHSLLLADVLLESRKIVQQPLDLAHAQLVLAELGKLHSGTFVMRQRQPELLARMRDLLARWQPVVLQNMRTHPQQWHDYYERTRRSLNADETGLQEEVEAARDSCAERMQKCVADVDNTGSQFDVLSHGDFWLQNLVFQYRDGADNEASRLPTGVCLIDWHAVQMVNPAVDITHFMFSSVETTVRLQYFWQLVQTYHDALMAAIRRELPDTDEQYPYETLKEHMQEYAQYGFLVAPWLLERHHGAEGMPAGDRAVEPVAYRQRMGDSVRDFIALEFEL